MNSILEEVYFHNTVLDYLIALGIIMVGTLVLRIIKGVFLERLRLLAAKTSSAIDDVLVTSLERFGVAALQFAVFYWGITYLNLSPKAERVIHVATSIVVTYFILRLLSTVILMLLQNRIKRQDR